MRTYGWEKVELEGESPFALYPGETIQIEKDNLVYDHFIELNEVQAMIIYIVNHFLVATTKMIHEELLKAGFEVNRVSLDRRLYSLSENAYLQRMVFTNERGRQPLKIYRLDRKAMGYLKAKRILPRKIGYLKSRTPADTKKLLAAIQAAQALADNPLQIEIAKMFVSDSVKSFLSKDKLFRAHAMVKREENVSYIIQPVRNEENAERQLLEKLQRMERTLKKYRKENEFQDEIVLLVVAENEIWRDYYENLFEKQHYMNFHVALTYDRLIANSEKTIAEKLRFVDTTKQNWIYKFSWLV